MQFIKRSEGKSLQEWVCLFVRKNDGTVWCWGALWYELFGAKRMLFNSTQSSTAACAAGKEEVALNFKTWWTLLHILIK